MTIQSALEIIRIAFGAGLVIANVFVWYGVYLEKEEFPKETQERGWRMLIRALAAEAALAFALLVVDTVISTMQRNEIANAETRASTADLEAARLGVDVDNLRGFVSEREREITADLDRFKKFAADEAAKASAAISDLNAAKAQLNQSRNDAVAAAQSAKADLASMIASLTQEEQTVEQEKHALEPRGMIPPQQDDFVEKMKAFGGLTVNVFMPPSNTSDAGPLAQLLVELLKKANWKVGYGSPLGGWAKYVLVCTGQNPNPNVGDAAKTIVLTLRADGIQSFIDPNMGPDVPLTGTGAPLQKPDMTILVGAKE